MSATQTHEQMPLQALQKPDPKRFRVGWKLLLFNVVLNVWLFLCGRFRRLLGKPRRMWPYRNWILVSRNKDVREVLEADQVFQVYYGERVDHIGLGPNFVLGRQDGKTYQAQQRQAMNAFRFEEVSTRLGPLAADTATRIVDGCGKRRGGPYTIDAIQDLMTRVPVKICEDYFGIPIGENWIAFSHHTFAISSYTFGDQLGVEPLERNASESARVMRGLLDNAIDGARSGNAAEDSVLRRLVESDYEKDVIRTYLLGMIIGFVPTNTLASGNMLDVLLKRPQFLAAASEAARSGDDQRLWRCLFEALRWKTIRAGPFRRCARDYTIASGTADALKVRKDHYVLAATRLAMFDSAGVKNPRRFDPDRSMTDYMHFGHGLHWCLGAKMAQEQITQTFMPLLSKQGLRRARGRAGKLRSLGAFPQHLQVEFDS